MPLKIIPSAHLPPLMSSVLFGKGPEKQSSWLCTTASHYQSHLRTFVFVFSSPSLRLSSILSPFNCLCLPLSPSLFCSRLLSFFCYFSLFVSALLSLFLYLIITHSCLLLSSLSLYSLPLLHMVKMHKAVLSSLNPIFIIRLLHFIL